MARPKLARQYFNLMYRSDTGAGKRLDVYLPQGKVPEGGWPVVVAIHGGGWRRFSKDEYGPKASVLTQYGYAVVLPNYSLSAPGDPSWPRNIQDVRGAVRWVRLNAESYHFDSSRIAAMGESAGGHLSLLLGMTADPVKNPRASAAVDAVISLAGPTDLKTLGRESPLAGGAARQMIGAAVWNRQSVVSTASPLAQVQQSDPPILLLHGLKDDVVPSSQSIRLAAALKAGKVKSQLVLLPGSGHLIPFTPGSVPLQKVVQFLRASMPRR